MMVKFNKLVAGAAFLSAFCTGCYEYPKPPASLLGESYTAREQGAADKLLEGISSLTLAEAQKIALLNNPDYISASQAIEAARFRYYQAIGAYSPTLGAGFRLSNGHAWAPHEVHTSTAYGRGDTFSTGMPTGFCLMVCPVSVHCWLPAVISNSIRHWKLTPAVC